LRLNQDTRENWFLEVKGMPLLVLFTNSTSVPAESNPQPVDHNSLEQGSTFTAPSECFFPAELRRSRCLVGVMTRLQMRNLSMLPSSLFPCPEDVCILLQAGSRDTRPTRRKCRIVLCAPRSRSVLSSSDRPLIWGKWSG
jgi:hypothetical protein